MWRRNQTHPSRSMSKKRSIIDWLRRDTSSARREQEMGGALHESGSFSVGLLEPIEFIAKLVVKC
jgi:hypothetical protein